MMQEAAGHIPACNFPETATLTPKTARATALCRVIRPLIAICGQKALCFYLFFQIFSPSMTIQIIKKHNFATNFAGLFF